MIARFIERLVAVLVAILTVAASSVPKETETEVRAVQEPKAAVYSIHGITPPVEWQRLLYSELKKQGIEWYYRTAICQIYQESLWNQYADNGQDRGITQQKEIYWSNRAARYGAKGASIWDVNAQLKVFASMMAEYLRASKNDIGWALSLYFYGNGEYADKYVADVMSHMDYLKEVK